MTRPDDAPPQRNAGWVHAARRLAASGCLVALASIVPAAAASDSEPFANMPDALWKVVSLVCVPSAAIGLPLPCAEVRRERGGGIAILPVSANHILTVPTTQVRGIESPDLLAPSSPNYWQAAYEARKYLKAGARHPLDRSMIGMAVNSEGGRSQEQFHIHTGCVSPMVHAAVTALGISPQDGWRKLRQGLWGGRYRVRAVLGEDLAKVDVFGLLEPRLRSDPAAMARQTIGVVGTRFGTEPGFIVFNADSRNQGTAHAEALLDFTCGLAPK